MQFSDIHIHALCNCDDGAKNAEYMQKMLDAAYADGERYICVTPHYNPGYFDVSKDHSKQSFEALLEYAKEKYPDLHLALGNELRYNPGCEEWLSAGLCRTMNNTKYVLIDFFEGEKKNVILNGLAKLLSSGYIPILAHAERYRHIRGDLAFIKEQRDNGVLIQIDARSVFGDFGFGSRSFCRKILQSRLADFVSSDAHSLKTRPPGIKKAYDYIEKKYGKSYAEAICFNNAFQAIFAE